MLSRLLHRRNPSGALSARDGTIAYAQRGRTVWDLPATEIAVVGAYTTAAGPVADDYFLVLIRRDGMVYEAPVYADGYDQTIAALEAALGAEIRLGLADSAEWRSQVVWPATLAGESLLEESGALAPLVWRFLREPHPGDRPAGS